MASQSETLQSCRPHCEDFKMQLSMRLSKNNLLIFNDLRDHRHGHQLKMRSRGAKLSWDNRHHFWRSDHDKPFWRFRPLLTKKQGHDIDQCAVKISKCNHQCSRLRLTPSTMTIIVSASKILITIFVCGLHAWKCQNDAQTRSETSAKARLRHFNLCATFVERHSSTCRA